MIEGRGAHNAGDTCCSSFRERKGDMARNAVSAPKKNIEVDCKACNCVHNKDCKCDAEKIGIAGGGACQCAETVRYLCVYPKDFVGFWGKPQSLVEKSKKKEVEYV